MLEVGYIFGFGFSSGQSKQENKISYMIDHNYTCPMGVMWIHGEKGLHSINISYEYYYLENLRKLGVWRLLL